MPNINDFPTELVLIIFGYMDSKTMITASTICRRWQELCKLPEQQYKVAQYRYSVVDGPPSDEWPAGRRLEALQVFQARWRRLSWVKSHTLDIDAVDQWGCFSGVYCDARRFQNWIALNKTPSIMAEGSKAMWSTTAPFPIRDLCTDVHQDLVVILSAEDRRARRGLHFLRMRSREPHPLARCTMVSDDLIPVWPDDSGGSIEIYGERVSILLRTTQPRSQIRTPKSALIVWNWKTGDKLMCVRSYNNRGIDSFCFLSPDHVLVVPHAGATNAGDSGWLEMYDFSNGLQHVTMRKFQLPRIQPTVHLGGLALSCEATPRPNSEAGRPFYTSPANCICMIATRYGLVFRQPQFVNYIVFASTFLGSFPNEYSHAEPVNVDGFRHISTVPWKEWNPHTCVTLWESFKTMCSVATYGTRVARLISTRNWGLSRVQICDFNPYVRHQVQDDSSPIVTCNYVGSHPLPVDSVFDEPVLSVLPYLATTTVQELDGDRVAMDFESIYLVKEGELQVLSF